MGLYGTGSGFLALDTSTHSGLNTLAFVGGGVGLTFVLLLVAVAIVFSVLLFIAQRYKRCPSNRILVIYGKVGGQRAAKAMHGGGAFIWPIIQSYAYLSLEPMPIDIELTSALSKKNIRVAVPSTFTIAISTEPDIMNNAAERMLGMDERAVAAQARDIILGQMRLVIATLSIEEINTDRERFLELVDKNVNFELNKIGLYMINVNIRDISDESGYIAALGQKAAAEAINQAKIDIADAERQGAIGVAQATREREVYVAQQDAQAEMGIKDAEREKRIKTAQLEAQGLSGEAEAMRQQDVAVSEQRAIAVQGQKQAETEQRVKVASLEADAVRGENESKAKVAAYAATLAEANAEAKRRGEVALAQATREVLMAQREEEQARLEKDVIVREEIERKKVEIDAEAEAEKIRRVARGEADATLAKYQAEAEGIQKMLQAKADGYRQLIESCGSQPDLAPSLLLIERLPELVAEQVKAIQNLKIDKITVWDGGSSAGQGGDGSNGTTSNFLRSLIGSLPPMHELAQQAGIDLPEVLGRVKDQSEHGRQSSGQASGQNRAKDAN